MCFFTQLSARLTLTYYSFKSLLSHGQATVERGFSVNKEVETCNLHDISLESLRSEERRVGKECRL